MVDRVAMGTRLRVSQELVQAGLDPWRDRSLEALRLAIGLGPAETDDLGQEPLAERVAAEDRVGRRSSRGPELELAALGERHEAVARQPPEHLARGLGADAQAAGHL